MHKDVIHRIYGHKLRVRTAGLCFSEGRLLLVRHKALTEKGYFFSPPGGGMEYGETAENCLRREFFEETGLEVKIKKFLFTHEFLSVPLHAIELFFEVEVTGGHLETGYDPEMSQQEQIIEEVKFMTAEEIKAEKGSQMHQIIQHVSHPQDLMNMQGYFKFDDKTLK